MIVYCRLMIACPVKSAVGGYFTGVDCRVLIQRPEIPQSPLLNSNDKKDHHENTKGRKHEKEILFSLARSPSTLLRVARDAEPAENDNIIQV
jgi:hypothetical protein